MATEYQTNYWYRRELENLEKYRLSELEYERQIDLYYKRMYDDISREIDSFYARYAEQNGITMAQAKKNVAKIDTESFSRKIKEMLNDKNLSSEAKERLKLYNLTMKINRMELLKSTIGAEMVRYTEEARKQFEQNLSSRAQEEYRRQAGILGTSVSNDFVSAAAASIVNASYHNATWSERIWNSQDILKAEVDRELQRAIIQGLGSDELGRKLKANVSSRVNNAMSAIRTLFRTELARVQTDVQMNMYKENGYEEYVFIAVDRACPTCKALDGRHFKVKATESEAFRPPIHPNCRCSTAAYYGNRDGVEEVYDDGEDNAYRRTAFNTQEDVKKYFDKITFLGCTNKTKRLILKEMEYMPIDDIKRLFQKPLVVTKAIGSANKCRPFYAMNVISLKENVKAGSFAHEVAHALCDRNNFGKGLQICASNVILKGYEVVTLNKDGRNLHIVTSPYFVEPYQGRLYASDDDLKRIMTKGLEYGDLIEYPSCGYKMYVTNPSKLKAVDPLLYYYFENGGFAHDK